MRFLDMYGQPLVEAAEPGTLHLLELAPGPTPDKSPGIAVEIRVESKRVRTILWLAGEPLYELRPARTSRKEQGAS